MNKLYVGLLVAAGVSVMVVAVAEGVNGSGSGAEASGGIQSSSWLLNPVKNSVSDALANSDGLLGISTKETHGLTNPGTVTYDKQGGIYTGYPTQTDKTGDYTDAFLKDNKFQPGGFTQDTGTVLEPVKVQQNDNTSHPYLTPTKDNDNTSHPYLTDKNKTDTTKTDPNETAEEKAFREQVGRWAESCKSAERQAEAKAIGGDQEAIEGALKDAGLSTSETCVEAGKQAMEACAKGDVKSTMNIWQKASDECDKVVVDTPNPGAEDAAANAKAYVDATLEGRVPNLLEQAQEKLKGLLNLDANGQANPMQQMIMTMLMQKVQEMMGGGSGSNTGGGDDDDGYVTPEPATCDSVVKSTKKTIVVYKDADTGDTITKTGKPVEDGSAVTSKTTVVDEDDDKTGTTAKDKIIKIETLITSDQCRNGNLRIKMLETKTYPSGKVEVTEDEDIIEDDE